MDMTVEMNTNGVIEKSHEQIAAENKEKFLGYLRTCKREGLDNLIAFLEESDFFKAPASTRFHGSYVGGLLEHSIYVYENLQKKKDNPGVWQEVLKDIPDESLIISALLHDICKTNVYVITQKNQKAYDKDKVAKAKFTGNPQVKKDNGGEFIWETVDVYAFEDNEPLGHGEKSAFMLLDYINLTAEEKYAIRWHMGPYSGEKDWNSFATAADKYPLVLAIFEADMEASHLQGV